MPELSVVADVGEIPPAVRFVSIVIGMLPIPVPEGFVTFAVIVAVPPVKITGVGGESASWAAGIGGPIVASIAFLFVAGWALLRGLSRPGPPRPVAGTGCPRSSLPS